MNARRGILSEPTHEDVTASALAGVPFAAYLVLMNLTTAPSAAQWSAADPILGILPGTLSLWITPLLALLCAAGWQRLAPLDRSILRRPSAPSRPSGWSVTFPIAANTTRSLPNAAE